MTDGSHPAYPNTSVFVWHEKDEGNKDRAYALPRWDGGLTKREYFAGMAMQGLTSAGLPVTTRQPDGVVTTNSTSVNFAVAALGFADALIAELNKKQEPL